MAAVILSLTACQKGTTDPEPEPEPEPEITTECQHTDMEYVGAVKRTGTTTGNVAHYHCNGCNRNFLDAAATNEVANPYLRATNYCISQKLLDKIKHIFPFYSASEQTKGGSASGGSGSVKPQAILKLFSAVSDFKTKKQEQAYVNEIIKDLTDIQTSLNDISEQVATIQAQNQEILGKLTDSKYKQAMGDFLNQEKFIWEACVLYFGAVKEAYDDYEAKKCDFNELTEKVKDAVYYWNENNQYNSVHIYPLTKQLIGSFNSHNLEGDWITGPQLFHYYNNTYRLWDHQGYTDRKQLDMHAEAVLSMGYFMAHMYMEFFVTYPSDKTRDADIQQFYDQFLNIDALTGKDLANMEEGDKAYRHFHNTNANELYICNNYVIANPDEVAYRVCEEDNLIFRVDDKTANIWSMNNISRWLDDKYDIGWKDGSTVSADDLTMILNAYVNGDIFKILRDTAGIAGMPQYHEIMNVEGANRTIILKYSSPNLNYYATQEKKCPWDYTTKTMDVWYNEYWAIEWGCGHEGSPNTLDLRCYEMTSSCKKGGCLIIVDRLYAPVQKYEYSVAHCEAKRDDWQPTGLAFVFLKKYTGVIADK